MVKKKEVKSEAPSQLAKASFSGDISPFGASGTFFMPGNIDRFNQALGLSAEKLMIPRDYHSVVRMCYDFYQRGGIASVVINRLAELSITKIRNGERKTSDEANVYYDAVLHRSPSRLVRFVNSMALEYFLSGMVLPRVDWIDLEGALISPSLKPNRIYTMPQFDWYPPLLVDVEWLGWGERGFFLKLPPSDIKLIKSGGGRIKKQQQRYQMFLSNFPTIVDSVIAGTDTIKIDVDAILRKPVSFSPYPTPFMMNVLEALIYKQQLRRMDFSVASRVINAVLLVQEGDEHFPLTEDNRENLDELKRQILGRQNSPLLQERVFELFSNHTTKMSWIAPDVEALLNQEKYRQANMEISEGLGFSQLLITGESRNAQASELSTYAIQPQMEEARAMILEWMQTIYEQCAERNKFRNIPVPDFTPVKLQDVVKTAAIFAQAFKEGNISRTTRDEQLGISLETEIELMMDEYTQTKELPKDFPPMPYFIPPNSGGLFGSGGRPPNSQNTGGRPQGSQNVPVNKRKSGVKLPNQQPTSKVKAAENLMNDEELINLMNTVAEERGIFIELKDILEEPAQNK